MIMKQMEINGNDLVYVSGGLTDHFKPLDVTVNGCYTVLKKKISKRGMQNKFHSKWKEMSLRIQGVFTKSL